MVPTEFENMVNGDHFYAGDILLMKIEKICLIYDHETEYNAVRLSEGPRPYLMRGGLVKVDENALYDVLNRDPNV